jgi:hypothetical protein
MGARLRGFLFKFSRLLNTVLVLEVGLTSGDLHHAEIYIFDDKMTPELCFYKGSSTSHPLLELILPLQLLEMTGQLHLFMVHVSGSRMIEQGTNGLSHRDTPACLSSRYISPPSNDPIYWKNGYSLGFH